MLEWSEVAGVSVEVPQPRYVLEQETGRATLTRVEAYRSTHFTLKVELSKEEHGRLWATLPTFPLEAVATFTVTPPKERDSYHGSRDESEKEGREHWRALLVEDGLLAHPAWLQRSVDVPGLPEPRAHALRLLRKRLQPALDLALPYGYQPAACEACQEVFDARARERDRRSGWIQPEKRQECLHVPLARRALRTLTEQHPALIFELAGLLVVDVRDGRFSRQGAEATDGQPQRFVLHPGVMEDLFGRWLLGGDTDLRRYHRYGQRTSRRNYRAVVDLENQDWGAAKPALQSATAFAANCWGYASPPGALVYRPSTAPPVHFPEPVQPADVQRLVPELAKPPLAPKGSAPSKIKKAKR
jgi:hypothetical protein